MSAFTVAKCRTFRGREGYGFNCDLYLNGVKVALVMDDASGGESDFEWVGKTAEERRKTEDRVLAAAVDLPDPEKYGLMTTLAIHVEDLVNGFADAKRLDRLRKAKVLFTIPGDKPNTMRTCNHNGQPDKAKAAMLAKYPNATFI